MFSFVGVLVRGPLPGRVRVAEVDCEVCCDCGFLVAVHLDALVPGQGSAQQIWQVDHFADEAVMNGIDTV